ncbi:MAG: hypothetical protein Q8T08_18035 [Ignavibacteria bacterium]|nr:hypothetical protein [Ignavibacteria bacterium]
MSLFKSSDERLIERFEKEEAEMLLRFYGLKKTDKNCPTNAYLLNPERLHLTSYEILPQNAIKLNVGYKTHWSGYVTKTIRMNYNQTVLGTIYCEEVESSTETIYNRIGTIKIPFLSKTKILNLPIRGTHNIEIKCNKLKVESIDIFVENEGKLIRDEEYREQLGEQLKNR